MDRLLNYCFSLLLVYIFALWAPPGFHGVIILGILLSLGISALAFFMRWLTLDGAAAALVVGTITFGLGGWPTALLVLCFFVSSTVLSGKYENEELSVTNDSRRNGYQVWANSFWLVTWLIIGILSQTFIYWMAAAAVLAVATADTWATELGSRRFDNSGTYLVTSLKPVPAGTDGGISVPGIVAALAGSFFISLVAMFGFSISMMWFLLIAVSGFLGSVLDSYIGAKFQGRICRLHIPGTRQKKKIVIDNNMVNWIATGLGSIILIILNQLFL